MDESEKGKQLVLHLLYVYYVLYRTCQAWTGGEEDSSTHVLVALTVPAIKQLLIVDAFVSVPYHQRFVEQKWIGNSGTVATEKFVWILDTRHRVSRHGCH